MQRDGWYAFEGFLKPSLAYLALCEGRRERSSGLCAFLHAVEQHDREMSVLDHVENPWYWETDRDVPDFSEPQQERLRRLEKHRKRTCGSPTFSRLRRHELLKKRLSDVVNELRFIHSVQQARIEGTLAELQSQRRQIDIQAPWGKVDTPEDESQGLHPPEHGESELRRSTQPSGVEAPAALESQQWIDAETRPLHPQEWNGNVTGFKLLLQVPALHANSRS